ncbi:MAG: hypothetical protein MZW92_02190 [Comamonadaceae bacterium]|nr:hypothetical protein [Comamonadaceae bacterium]
MYDGKLIEGGGIFFLANPAYALIRNALVISASSKYEFDILDFDGNIAQTHAFEASDPELTEGMKTFNSSGSLKNYAVAKIMPLDRDILIVSNYYLKGKPRIDRFFGLGSPYLVKCASLRSSLLLRRISFFKANIYSISTGTFPASGRSDLAIQLADWLRGRIAAH